MVELLGEKGTKQNFIIAIDWSFDNLPDAQEVLDSLVDPIKETFKNQFELVILDKKELK